MFSIKLLVANLQIAQSEFPVSLHDTQVQVGLQKL